MLYFNRTLRLEVESRVQDTTKCKVHTPLLKATLHNRQVNGGLSFIMGRKLDLTGQRFGRLEVIKFAYSDKKGRRWECKCDCGGTSYVVTGQLRSGGTCSCGNCLQRINNALDLQKEHKKLYCCWRDMVRRCHNPKACNYQYYGERGIEVCKEWRNDFYAFYDWAVSNGYDKETYGKFGANKYSLDRIDNNKDYSPDNCRFASKREQNINKRPTYKNTSGFVGICKHSSCDMWYGRVRDESGKIRYTGMDKDIIIATKMRNDYIIDHKLSNQLNDLSAYGY